MVYITYGGQAVPRSPFQVDVGKPIESRIRAFGPGLQLAIAGKPAKFTVDTNGELTKMLKFFIEGPEETRIECDDKQDGSVDVTYFPTAPGTYLFHILSKFINVFILDVRNSYFL